MKVFPKSLYVAKKYFVGEVEFVRFVVRRKCFNIHLFKDCVEGPKRSRVPTPYTS